MDKFTASNGIHVWLDDNVLYFDRPDDIIPSEDERAVAVREFFLAERDAELGRWRHPELTNYVVYPEEEDPDTIRVLFEPGGGSSDYKRGWTDGVTNPDTWDIARVVRDYFAAHPEPAPRPWEDAQPGEVWALTTPALGERAYEATRDGAHVRFFLITDEEIRSGLFSFEKQITGGRLVWKPEVQ